jgi:hypothetical protein
MISNSLENKDAKGANMAEIGYQVVWPLGKLAYQMVSLQPRISDFNGKTICELSDYGFKGEEIFPIIRESLRNVYPSIKFVEYTKFPNTHASDEAQVIKNLPELLRENGCDAVISGVGG